MKNRSKKERELIMKREFKKKKKAKYKENKRQ